MTETPEPAKRQRREHPARGILLRDLDRSRRYLIGYVGRRWEVLGPVADPPAGDGARAGADREAASTRGRHAAPDCQG